MQLSPDLMRMLLLFCMLAMVVLAVFYLRQQKLPWINYAFWGLLAIMLPLVGPFLVIWIQPGKKRITDQA